MFLYIPYIKADSCTREEITKLKEETTKIKVTYEHLGEYKTEEDIDYNHFNIEVFNIPDNYYIMFPGDETKYEPEEGKTNTILTNGKWIISIYSNKCDEVIDTITIKLPTFNMYSLDPQCEGVDTKEFPLCGKYYEQTVSYENFQKRLSYYKSTHQTVQEPEPIENPSIFTKILNFIIKYKYYTIGIVSLIIIITIITIVVKKRRNRGVLK